jgi:predicted nucleic acid-binding protein
MILVDTSVFIDLLQGKIEAEKPEEHENLATCFPVQCELYKGTRIARNTEKGEKQVRKLLDTMDELEADRESAEKFAGLREKYPEINELDLMIAGICLSNGASILSQNEDFHEIEELEVRTADK